MGDLESAGKLFGERAALENEFKKNVDRELKKFVEDVQKLGLQAVGTNSLAGLVGVNGLWAAAADRLLVALPAALSLVELFRVSSFPAVMLETVTAECAAALGARVTGAEFATRLRGVLGLASQSAVSGAEFGRLVTAEGSRSWLAEGARLARSSSTADLAADTLGQLRAEGFTHKRWATRFDSRVRDTHVAADRQTVPLERQFTVGGVSLRYPGDPAAGAPAEVDGCRCVLVGVRFGRNALDQPEGEEPWNNTAAW